jgi:hypothetical protein
MPSRYRFIVALAFAAGAANASAQACAGFTDVLATDSLCPSVEWLKNRQITLGCAVGLYCPNEPVSRLAMAAFMNRLGKALSPQILKRHGSLGATTLPGESPTPPLIVCRTDSTTATYPRAALVNASFTALADASAVAYRAFLLYSLDNGATWLAFDDEGNPPAPIATPRASSAGNQWSGVALTYAANYLDPNVPFSFAIGIRRDNGLLGTTGNFAATRCQLTATVLNANGTESPY